MGKMIERTCRFCGNVYRYEGAANFIAFCPHCKEHDITECEYGYGAVTPCRIYLGERTIGEVKGDSRSGFEVLMPEYDVCVKSDSGDDPLMQAANIVSLRIKR